MFFKEIRFFYILILQIVPVLSVFGQNNQAFPVFHYTYSIDIVHPVSLKKDQVKGQAFHIETPHLFLCRTPVYHAKGAPFEEEDAGSREVVITDSVSYFQTFIWEKNAAKGHVFRKGLPPAVVDVSTELKQALPFFEGLLEQPDLVLSSFEKAGEGQLLTERYVFKEKKELSDPDSILLYFDRNLNDMKPSISERLDKEKGMKLFKVKIIHNAYHQSGVEIPVRVFEFAWQRSIAVKKEAVEGVLEEYNRFVQK